MIERPYLFTYRYRFFIVFLFLILKKIFAPPCIGTKSIYTSNHTESNSRRNLIFEFIFVFCHKKKYVLSPRHNSSFFFFFGRIAISFRNISIKREQPSAPIKSFQWPTNDNSTFLLVQRSPKRLYSKDPTIGRIFIQPIFIHEF